MLSIKNNLMAEVASRQLGKSYSTLAGSIAKLSSGLRINSAKDDAAGLAVRELIRADVAQLRQGSRNAADGISMLQTAEGALSSVNDILVRMKELAEQAATESYSAEQRAIMNAEFAQLSEEIDRIAGNTAFNSINLLNATTTYDIHIGAGAAVVVGGGDMTAAGLGVGGTKEVASGGGTGSAGDAYFAGDATDSLKFTFDNGEIGQQDLLIDVEAAMTLTQVVAAINVVSRGIDSNWDAAEAAYNSDTGQYVLKLTHKDTADAVDLVVANVGAVTWGGGTLGTEAVASGDFVSVNGTGVTISIADAGDAATALGIIQDAIESKDTTRAKLGYLMNRLEAAISVIDIQAENLAAAESRVSDVDVATEVADMTRTQVLAQAGISMLAQANTIPQMALTLLR